MSGYEVIQRLAAIIKLLADYPQGLSMLTGSVPPPSAKDINIIIESIRPTAEPTRTSGGTNEPEADRLLDTEELFNSVIERVGGWRHINESVCEWKKVYPKAWRVVTDNVRFSRSRVDGVNYDFIARRNHLCRDTVYRIINNFPQELAVAIMNTPIDGVLQLRYN